MTRKKTPDVFDISPFSPLQKLMLFTAAARLHPDWTVQDPDSLIRLRGSWDPFALMAWFRETQADAKGIEEHVAAELTWLEKASPDIHDAIQIKSVEREGITSRVTDMALWCATVGSALGLKLRVERLRKRWPDATPEEIHKATAIA